MGVNICWISEMLQKVKHCQALPVEGLAGSCRLAVQGEWLDGTQWACALEVTKETFAKTQKARIIGIIGQSHVELM